MNRNPFHVTYVLDADQNHANLRLVGDHAYWVSGVTRRDTSNSEGQIDALSHGFGKGDPAASSTQLGTGTLTGGNMGNLVFSRQFRTWGATPAKPKADQIDVIATNVWAASINVHRAQVDCQVKVNITSDGPIAIKLPGCNRTVHGG